MPTKERILHAANDVALRDGVINLTLEAVAKEAGLSKGGLLYHFPNKEALVAGLVARFADHFEETLHNALHNVHDAGPTDPAPTDTGAFTRSFINATFDDSPAPRGLHAGLLAAMLLNPDLLEGAQDKYEQWHDKIQDDGLDPTLASLLRYAADGIWASELLGLAPPSAALREQLRELMLTLTRKPNMPHATGSENPDA